MDISDGRSVSSILERDVDLAVIQLLQTDHSFRQWFVRQLEDEDLYETFIGVSHSVTDTKGESDIVFGIETTNDKRWLGLVENKIDAEKQERQAERYFERGRSYVSSGEWDTFRVGLIAPRRYVGETERDEFGSVVQYEDIISTVADLDHDGVPYFLDVFERAVERRSGTDHSDMTTEVSQRLIASDTLPDLERPTVTPTQVRLFSRHPKHPGGVHYRVYIPGSKNGNKTIVRLQIGSDMPEGKVSRIRSLLSGSIDDLPGFEYEPENIMNPVWKEIWRQDNSPSGRSQYVTRIVTAVHELLDFYHPRLVSMDIED